MTRLIGIHEAGSYLGRSYKTVLRMIHAGELEAVMVGNAWRLDPDRLPQPGPVRRSVPPPKPRRAALPGSHTEAALRVAAQVEASRRAS